MNNVRLKENENGRVLVVGCGNVGGVALHKMAQCPDVFREIHAVSLTKKNVDRVRRSVLKKSGTRLWTWQEDMSDRNKASQLINRIRPDLVVNLGPPYWNLEIMRACLVNGVHYLDTACHEHPDEYGFSNERQRAFHREFKKQGLMAMLQCGFDPGVTNLFVAYAIQKNLLDSIDSIDILDCNAGEKDAVWAPNFDPEINIRELILPVLSVLDGEWKEHGRIIDEDAVRFNFHFPEAGKASAYLMYHEELESLKRSFPGIRRMRFWMTFSQQYLMFLRVLHMVGLTRIDPVDYEGHPVIPVKFLKRLLPKGTDFNDSYTGKTNIGCILQGHKNGRAKVIHIYQVCDHEEAFRETGGNAIGYTTAVPAVVAAMMMLRENSPWLEAGVHVPETRRAEPFLELLAECGLPWQVKELEVLPKFLRQDF